MPISIDSIKKSKRKTKLSMVTCYDYWSARILDRSNIDMLLVGDSAAMVMHGHKTTLPATPEIMALHTEAVCRGAPGKFVIGDLPFLSFRKSLDASLDAVGLLMRAGAEAVKLEGAEGNLDLISHLVSSGIPVMGHLGLTPQSVNQLGGFKVQARSKEAADLLLQHAQDLEKAGCFSIVLECVPSPVARRVTEALEIPTIGIGAGMDTDGQVLVLHDLLGLNSDFQAKFVRQYVDGAELINRAINEFHEDVRNQKFPTAEESYE